MVSQLIRKLSFVPAVRSLVITTGLRGVAQKLYHRQFGPPGGVLPLCFAGADARFYTPTVRELRGLEFFSSGGVVEFKRLVSMLRQGDTFFDIGAQYGAYAYLVSNAVGRSVSVVAFEPFPRDYALLKRNGELNQLANVRCVQAALSDHNGDVSMTFADETGEFCPRVGVATSNSEKVKAVRGDALIATGKVPFPNVLKIDVEGHELAVLRGMSETLADPRCHGIYCEIHDSLLPAGDTTIALIALLKDKGFNRIYEWPGPNHYIFAEKV
jgi:FkbM family methyltransferase